MKEVEIIAYQSQDGNIILNKELDLFRSWLLQFNKSSISFIAYDYIDLDFEKSELYIMYSFDRDIVKIGISKNPINRLSNICFHNGLIEDCVLLGVIISENAKDLEIHLHYFFKSVRKNGEWFKLSHRDIFNELLKVKTREKYKITKIIKTFIEND